MAAVPETFAGVGKLPEAVADLAADTCQYNRWERDLFICFSSLKLLRCEKNYMNQQLCKQCSSILPVKCHKKKLG